MFKKLRKYWNEELLTPYHIYNYVRMAASATQAVRDEEEKFYRNFEFNIRTVLLPKINEDSQEAKLVREIIFRKTNNDKITRDELNFDSLERAFLPSMEIYQSDAINRKIPTVERHNGNIPGSSLDHRFHIKTNALNPQKDKVSPSTITFFGPANNKNKKKAEAACNLLKMILDGSCTTICVDNVTQKINDKPVTFSCLRENMTLSQLNIYRSLEVLLYKEKHKEFLLSDPNEVLKHRTSIQLKSEQQRDTQIQKRVNERLPGKPLHPKAEKLRDNNWLAHTKSTTWSTLHVLSSSYQYEVSSKGALKISKSDKKALRKIPDQAVPILFQGVNELAFIRSDGRVFRLDGWIEKTYANILRNYYEFKGQDKAMWHAKQEALSFGKLLRTAIGNNVYGFIATGKSKYLNKIGDQATLYVLGKHPLRAFNRIANAVITKNPIGLAIVVAWNVSGGVLKLATASVATPLYKYTKFLVRNLDDPQWDYLNKEKKLEIEKKMQGKLYRTYQ